PPSPLVFGQRWLNHLEMGPPRHRRGCQPRLSARTDRHYLPPLGLARMIRLPGSLLPSSRRGLGENFGSKVIGPACVPAIEIASAWPAGRSLLSQPRLVPGLFFYSVHISAGGKKQASHWGWLAPAARLPHASCGLTGLLNPTSIWHKTISIVFHKVFRSCFVHWNRPNQLEQAANAAFELLPIASVEDCL